MSEPISRAAEADRALSLGEKQELFSELKAKWTLEAIRRGYKVRAGEGRILERGADGNGRRAVLLIHENGKAVGLGRQVLVQDLVHKSGGCHGMGLAEDPQLFKNGRHLTATADYLEMGEYWESLHPLCHWGGRFKDGNHISITHNGVR